MATRQFNLKLTDEQIERLAAESERTGAPKAELIRRAIDAYFAYTPAHLIGRPIIKGGTDANDRLPQVD